MIGVKSFLRDYGRKVSLLEFSQSTQLNIVKRICSNRNCLINSLNLGKYYYYNCVHQPLQQYRNMASDARQMYLAMPLEEKRKQYLSKNYVTLQNMPNWPEYCGKNNLTKRANTCKTIVNHDYNKRISIFTGDITNLEIDCIVNAANTGLKGGGGVDGAIHRAAGHDLLQAECQKLGGCNTGDAKLTGGYKLPAKYIIHTVGPIGEKPDLLKSCYRKCLDVMKENNLKSIAFPCIATGVYHYPNDAAANVAVSTVRSWLEENDDYAKLIDRIIFCLFLENDKECYYKYMPYYFPIE